MIENLGQRLFQKTGNINTFLESKLYEHDYEEIQKTKKKKYLTDTLINELTTKFSLKRGTRERGRKNYK